MFHLSCLDPPLTQKPKTGYSWSCAPCSKAHEDEVEEYTESGTAITKKIAGDALKKSRGKGSDGKGAGNGALDKGKGKEGMPDLDTSLSISHRLILPCSVSPADSVTGLRLTNQWPMRYFGMHTEAYSVLGESLPLNDRRKYSESSIDHPLQILTILYTLGLPQ